MRVLRRGLQRWIAGWACLCFLFSLLPEASLALPALEIAAKSEMPRMVNIDIPTDLASVDAWYQAAPKNKPQMIVHIQDAHSNYEAQIKIRDVIRYLNKNYGFKTLLVEGAAENPDPKYLKLFPDKERNVKLLDELAKEGEVSGAEMFLMEDEGAAQAIGIERVDLYKKNFDALQNVFREDTMIRDFLDAYEKKLGQVGSRTFSPHMIQALGEWRKFESGHRDFLPFVSKLAELSKSVLKIDLETLYAQVEWPQLTRLLVLQKLEKALDQKASEPQIAGAERNVKQQAVLEKQAIIDLLKAKNVSAGLIEALEKFDERTANLNRLTAGEARQASAPRALMEALVDQGAAAGFKVKDYPSFAKYAGCLILRSEVVPGELFDELKALFNRLLDRLVNEAASAGQIRLETQKERDRLLQLYRDEVLLRKLLALELSRDEWLAVLDRRNYFNVTQFTNRLREAANLKIDRNPDGAKLQRQNKLQNTFTQAIAFYEAATNREDYFFVKMREVLAKTDKAILITGGFHADGISDWMRKNEISYGTLTPRISSEFSNEKYRKVMTEGMEPVKSPEVSAMPAESRMLSLTTLIRMTNAARELFRRTIIGKVAEPMGYELPAANTESPAVSKADAVTVAKPVSKASPAFKAMNQLPRNLILAQMQARFLGYAKNAGDLFNELTVTPQGKLFVLGAGALLIGVALLLLPAFAAINAAIATAVYMTSTAMVTLGSPLFVLNLKVILRLLNQGKSGGVVARLAAEGTVPATINKRSESRVQDEVVNVIGWLGDIANSREVDLYSVPNEFLPDSSLGDLTGLAKSHPIETVLFLAQYYLSSEAYPKIYDDSNDNSIPPQLESRLSTAFAEALIKQFADQAHFYQVFGRSQSEDEYESVSAAFAQAHISWSGVTDGTQRPYRSILLNAIAFLERSGKIRNAERILTLRDLIWKTAFYEAKNHGLTAAEALQALDDSADYFRRAEAVEKSGKGYPGFQKAIHGWRVARIGLATKFEVTDDAALNNRMSAWISAVKDDLKKLDETQRSRLSVNLTRASVRFARSELRRKPIAPQITAKSEKIELTDALRKKLEQFRPLELIASDDLESAPTNIKVAVAIAHGLMGKDASARDFELLTRFLIASNNASVSATPEFNETLTMLQGLMPDESAAIISNSVGHLIQFVGTADWNQVYFESAAYSLLLNPRMKIDLIVFSAADQLKFKNHELMKNPAIAGRLNIVFTPNAREWLRATLRVEGKRQPLIAFSPNFGEPLDLDSLTQLPSVVEHYSAPNAPASMVVKIRQAQKQAAGKVSVSEISSDLVQGIRNDRGQLVIDNASLSFVSELAESFKKLVQFMKSA